MTANTITQITPAYHPESGGVADYAYSLGLALSSKGVKCSTLVTREDIDETNHDSGVIRVPGIASLIAKELMHAERLLLHFSGYGYAKRGLCQWLGNAIQTWRINNPQGRLITIFHEVFAKGPLWRSSFWTAAPQRQIAKQLARVSDKIFVTSQGGLKQLTEFHTSASISLLPVFSNVGEPNYLPQLVERIQRAVVFGGNANREAAYRALSKSASSLWDGFNSFGIQEVLDIGPDAAVPSTLNHLPVRKLGSLPATSVSEVLLDSSLGIINYPGHVFSKSGIAAAYFSHKLLVVNTSNIGNYPKDLTPDHEFITLDCLKNCNGRAQRLADAGFAWYQGHNLERTVGKIISFL